MKAKILVYFTSYIIWRNWRTLYLLGEKGTRKVQKRWQGFQNVLFLIFVLPTFHYNSPLWANKNEFNRPGGKTGFDSQQTKLPTYWNTPLSKICLGMKIGHQIKFIIINRHANSLYSLIADGRFLPTSLGRNTWKTLIGSQASSQTNCNKDGFNAVGSVQGSSKARIGILGNNENDCATPDSRIGFGTGGYHDDYNTCGNEASGRWSSDNGVKHIKAMGYILVYWQNVL